MKNDTEPRGPQQEFPSKPLDILLGNDTDAITHFLEQHTSSYIDLLVSDDEEELPHPLHSIQIKGFIASSPELLILSLSGSISVLPLSLEAVAGAWPDDILEKIEEVLRRTHTGDVVQHLTHDRYSFYVTLDTRHVMRVCLQPHASAVSVSVSIEDIQKVESATGAQFEVRHSSIMKPIDALRHVTAITGLAADIIQQTYADNSPARPRSIEPIKDTGPDSQNTLSQSKHPILPEIERLTSTSKGFDSIGGATKAKERFRELSFIVNDPEGAAAYDLHPSHILLHGPPGVGKTSLAEAFAHETGIPITVVDSTDIIGSLVGSSGKNLKEIFATAKQSKTKVILFFDEFDSIAATTMAGAGEREDVRKLLNKEIEDITRHYPHVIIIGATNADLDALEQSLIRSGRFETITVPLPNQEERIDIWGVVFFESVQRLQAGLSVVVDDEGNEIPQEGYFQLYADDINLIELATHTDGMTGADFKTILERARKKCFLQYRMTKQKRQVHQADLLEIIRTFNH